MPFRLLLDTSSLMYRAFYALPPTISDQQGKPANAIHGYLDMTARLLTDYAPDELIHVYDADWRPAGRVAIYPPYKGNRPEDPVTLPPQFDRLREILTALGNPPGPMARQTSPYPPTPMRSTSSYPEIPGGVGARPELAVGRSVTMAVATA